MEEDNTVAAENVEAVEDNSVEASPATETTTSESSNETDSNTEDTQVNESDAEDTKTEDSEHKPTRSERRIRQLANENRQLRSQYSQQIPNYGQPPQTVTDLGDEITPEVYGQHVAQAAQSIVNPQLDALRGEFETKEALNNFDRDMEHIEKTYDELKEGGPWADILEKQITDEFKQKAYRPTGLDPVTGKMQYRVDPSVRLADIAAQKVADAREIAEKANADIKNAVANQADNTALKPSAGKRQEKSFTDLSISEMEKQLGYAS